MVRPYVVFISYAFSLLSPFSNLNSRHDCHVLIIYHISNSLLITFYILSSRLLFIVNLAKTYKSPNITNNAILI